MKKFSLIDCAFLILLILVTLFNLSRIKLGLGGLDESFYLATPRRILAGNSLLVDEWHPSQLSAFILVPFVKIHDLIFSSNEGMLLHFRYVYLIVNLLVTILMYINLKKISKIGALFASILYFSYVPFAIMALSYNTLGLMLFLLSGIFLLNTTKNYKYILAGVFFALGVLCNPYMVITFIIYSVLVVANNYIKFTKTLSIKKYLYFVLGLTLPATIFLIYCILCVDLKSLPQTLHYILNEPAHLPRSFGKLVEDYFYTFKAINVKLKYVYLAMFLINIVAIFAIRLKDYYKIVLLLVNTLLVFIIFYKVKDALIVNYVMIPIFLLGATYFILNKKRDVDVFIHIYMLGIFYSFFMNMSSNNYYWVVASGMVLSLVATVIFMFDYVKQLENLKYLKVLAFSLVITCLCVQEFMQVSSRLNYVFWQENPTQIVTRGVAKGLLADEKYKAEYDYSYKVYDEVANIADIKNNSVVYLGPIMLETGIPTWLYLENRNSVDSLSVWLGDPRLSDRQKSYYEIHKNKPKYVYIDNKVKNNGLLEVYSENEYNKHNLTDGILLEKK